ncbi:Gfo/Idh/MocA family oxidoreductase [Aliifodinibius sp. S!AR15-10]|uniref:Gfo/Idh/MocA family protein n=1 Tax=Aliifodinibius sp. S!AR15-10 TaxID=2950437 RepID=UPI00285BDE2B|nr:Gfo/Idh/MocA family oxidoreductase [Aliifodinibius sp. S!AR15-10]MDR8390063.1 Gfo/Idh/MocA family oxidoreductase [Aliifodinibius sp. S!AR15-10]
MGSDQPEYGIGIVGCGNISNTHAEAIKRTKRGKLVSAYSRTRQTIRAFAKEYDITAFTSYDDFLADTALDVVAICTPTGTHLDYARAAAKAGKHVIVEKPIEVSIQRGKSLINSCETNGVKLAVIYQSRFIDDVTRMRQLVKQQKLGKIVMASASVKWFRSQEYYSDSSWRGTYKLDGGGVVINQSIHTVDLLQWVMGRIDSIAAFKGTFTHGDIEAEDNAVACLKFRNGAIGVFEASTSIDPPQDRQIEINGTKGTLLLKGDRLHTMLDDQTEVSDESDSTESAGAASPLAGMTFQHHKKQYDAILEAFFHDKVPTVSGAESLRSLAIVEALYKAADEQQIIHIDEILDSPYCNSSN